MLNDVCKFIGIKNKGRLIMGIKKDEDLSKIAEVALDNQRYNASFINENGLYKLLLRSDS